MQERELGFDAVLDLFKCYSERVFYFKWLFIFLSFQGGCEGVVVVRKFCRGFFQLREFEEVIRVGYRVMKSVSGIEDVGFSLRFGQVIQRQGIRRVCRGVVGQVKFCIRSLGRFISFFCFRFFGVGVMEEGVVFFQVYVQSFRDFVGIQVGSSLLRRWRIGLGVGRICLEL